MVILGVKLSFSPTKRDDQLCESTVPLVLGWITIATLIQRSEHPNLNLGKVGTDSYLQAPWTSGTSRRSFNCTKGSPVATMAQWTWTRSPRGSESKSPWSEESCSSSHCHRTKASERKTSTGSLEKSCRPSNVAPSLLFLNELWRGQLERRVC